MYQINIARFKSLIRISKSKLISFIALIICMSYHINTSAQNMKKLGKDDEAQKMATNQSSFQRQYEKNIKKSRINGVYIPADIYEAFEELNALSESEGVKKFKNASEDVISTKLHFGLGRWISVNWNLEEGSRYEHYLRNLGLVNVDNMIQFTIVSWHRHLLGKDLDIKNRVAAYQEKMKMQLETQKAQSEVIHKKTRPIKD